MVIFSMDVDSLLVDGYIVRNKYWVGLVYCSEMLVKIRGLLNFLIICRYSTCKNSGTFADIVSLMILYPCI